MNDQQLLKLKSEIEAAKADVSELKGRKTELYKTLKNKHSCSSIEEAEEKIDKLDLKIRDLRQQESDLLKELKEKYDL
jgi:hypothetical protein